MINTKEIAQTILLHPNDNVLVCVVHIYAGDEIIIDDQAVRVTTDIEVGHKLARYALAPGTKIYRYGAPIGSMTQEVALGEHVHMHNMQSDYIPSHTRTRQNQERSEN